MFLKQIEQRINIDHFKEDARKIGINFVTAGVVGVFINHFVGTTFSTMFWASFWITTIGFVFLLLGIFRRNIKC